MNVFRMNGLQSTHRLLTRLPHTLAKSEEAFLINTLLQRGGSRAVAPCKDLSH